MAPDTIVKLLIFATRPLKLVLAYFSFFLLTVIFCACSSAPPDAEEQIYIPDSFSEAGTSPVQQLWWSSLDDPILDNLIETALQGNFDLKMAWDKLDQARAVASIAGAQLWPSLNGEAVAGRNFSDQQAVNNFGLGLVASYELDFWGRVRSARKAAGFDFLSQTENMGVAALSLSAQVATAWYELVYSYALIDLINEQKKTNEQVLELTEWRFRKGKADLTDVLQQRQLVEASIGRLEQALASAEVQEHLLAVLLGRSPTEVMNSRISTLIDLPSLPKTGLPLDLIKRRPDVRSVFFKLKASDSRIAEAVANRFPKFSISAGISTSAPRTQDLFNNWVATLSANLLAPLFEGGARAAEVERTEAAAFEAFHDFCGTVISAVGEVEDALTMELRLSNYLDSLTKQFQLSVQALERARSGYLKGAENYLRVLDALTSHQNIQMSIIGARFDLIENRIRLYRALAGSWSIARGAKGTYENLPEFNEGVNR